MGCLSSKPGLSPNARNTLSDLFRKMDIDGSGDITRKEAVEFWSKSFAKLNAEAFFNEVDADESKSITLEEYLDFWEQVKKNNYSEKEILQEVNNMIHGGSWVDWKDGRSTNKGAKSGQRKSQSKC
mmetsp:Transcript_13409/g.15216  ORF Transcript_13409/g.15216 Transcript_13409/m.15216 type:complete len:126 (-) Transcript_13409:307-684(-)